MTRSPLEFPANCSSGLPIFFLGLISLGTGVRHDNAACVALGVALALAPLAVFAMLRWSLGGVRVTRSSPESAFEGDTVEVRIELHNGSRLPLFYPLVGEIFIPEVHAPKLARFPYRVLPGETVVEVYRGDCMMPRGIYALGPAWVSISDPFGWFELRKRTAPPMEIKVYPRFRAFGVADRLGACLSVVFNDTTRFGIGESNEFFSVREYRPGDPLRRIHWGLTAHRGFPVVREFTRTAVGDLFLCLDLHRYAMLGVGRGSSLEQGVKIVASLSSHAIERGHRVQLLACGDREISVPTGKGKAHFRTILDALVEVKPDGPRPLDDVLDGKARDVAAGGTVVITVSPYLYESDRFRQQLISMRRRGVRVVLVVFDGSTFRNLYEVRGSEMTAAAYSLYMRAIGMETVVVPCAADLPVVFSSAAAGTAAGSAA